MEPSNPNQNSPQPNFNNTNKSPQPTSQPIAPSPTINTPQQPPQEPSKNEPQPTPTPQPQTQPFGSAQNFGPSPISTPQANTNTASFPKTPSNLPPTPPPTTAMPTPDSIIQPTVPIAVQNPISQNKTLPNQPPSRIFNLLIGLLLLIAGGFIGYFIYAQSFSGTVVYKTGPLTFSSGQATQTVSQQLEPTGNPYRPQVSLKYQRQIGGINIGRILLASYTITINNQSQQPIYQDSGSFSFKDKNEDEGSGTSTVTTNTNSKDFLIENSGQYQLNFAAQIPKDLDADFNIKSIQLRLRSQVKSAPIWTFLVGLISGFAVFILIVIKRRSKKSAPQTAHHVE